MTMVLLGGNLSRQQVANYAQAAGFSRTQIPIAVAIAEAESHLDPNTIGPTNSNGTTDYGLFQINSRWTASGFKTNQYANPAYNAQWAKRIYDIQGWGAWSTYNNGAYLTYYDPNIAPGNFYPSATFNQGSPGGESGTERTGPSTEATGKEGGGAAAAVILWSGALLALLW